MSKISHTIIKSLYEVLDWYSDNKGVGKAGVVLSYYRMWSEFHALTVNISDEGWREIRELASKLNINLGKKGDREWLLLFALETYLHLL